MVYENSLKEARMRISISKSIVLCWKTVDCALWACWLLLVKELKYLKVLFASQGKIERKINKTIDATLAVTWSFVVKKRSLAWRRSSWFTSWLMFQPSAMHELWEVFKKTKPANMTLLHRVSLLTVKDRMRSLNIWKKLGVDLYIEWNWPLFWKFIDSNVVDWTVERSLCEPNTISLCRVICKYCLWFWAFKACWSCWMVCSRWQLRERGITLFQAQYCASWHLRAYCLLSTADHN